MATSVHDVRVTPTSDREAIIRSEKREISLLVASAELCLTHARYGAGEPVAKPHVHQEHTDAFYVLEGELTFKLGNESEMTLPAGGFVAVPPGVVHSFWNAGDRTARWLTIHAPDGGFAAFMRGVRDGVEVEWDVLAGSPDDSVPASNATVSLAPTTT
jgi:mannose-6-phosphate isomerase-like protein (cupin superfamily)